MHLLEEPESLVKAAEVKTPCSHDKIQPHMHSHCQFHTEPQGLLSGPLPHHAPVHSSVPAYPHSPCSIPPNTHEQTVIFDIPRLKPLKKDFIILVSNCVIK